MRIASIRNHPRGVIAPRGPFDVETDVHPDRSDESPLSADPIPAYRRRVPPLPSPVLPRARIDAALREAPGVVLLTSAAGYGATTALVQAAAGVSGVNWLSLDDTVPDEAALAMARQLVQGPGWHVIDAVMPDVHPGLCEVLPELAETVPSGARLIIASNGRVDLEAATSFDEDLLAFTSDEAMRLLSLLIPDMSVDDATALIEAAAGWASALVAGAYRLRAGQPAGVHTVLPAQLFTGWLQTLPSARRRLLAEIAVAEEVSDSLVAAITSDERGLRGLVDAHNYLRPTQPPSGHQGRWWQVHPMLTTLLRQGFADESTGCHARAAQWFADRGDITRAMDHYIAAGRFPEAIGLLESHQSELLSTGSAESVLRWYTETAQRHEYRVDSLLRASWGRLLAGDLPGAEAAAAKLRAEVSSVARLPDREPSLSQRLADWRSEVSMLTSYMAGFQGDPATVIAAAQQAMDFPSPRLTPNVAQMAPLLVTRGRMWSGDYVAAVAALRRSDDLVVNRVVGHLQRRGVQAMLCCLSGEITVAVELVDRMWEWARKNDIDIQQVPMFSPELAKASVLLEQGHLDQATEVAQTVGARARAGQHLSDATWALLVQARALLFQERIGQAQEVLGQARETATSRVADSALLVPIGHVQAQAFMAAGDMLRAQRILRDLPASQTRTLLSLQADLVRTPVQARRMLETLAVDGPRATAVRHLLLSALHVKDSTLIAGEHLKAAASVAVDHGIQMLLAAPDPGVRDLAEELATDTADLRWLLSALGPPAEPSVLSRGDLQLLALIPSRAKNQDLADALGISVNTVKTRLRRLYARLGVSSRDEAIEVARQRGLL